jgi:hypothetical protein
MVHPIRVFVFAIFVGFAISHEVSGQSIVAERAYEKYLSHISEPVAMARANLSVAISHFEEGRGRVNVYVVVILRNGYGYWEQVFMRVLTWDDDLVGAELASRMNVVEGYDVGSLFVLKNDRILDWLVVHADSTTKGGYIAKFLQK